MSNTPQRGSTAPEGFSGNSDASNSNTTDTYNLKNFLKYYNNLGIQVKNNFSVIFQGVNENLNNMVFYIQTLTLPGITYNTTEIMYDGHTVDVPVNYDFNREISMTMINDAQGYLYSFLFEYFKLQSSLVRLDSKLTMIIKSIPGGYYTDYSPTTIDQSNFKREYAGQLINLYGVRITDIGGVDFSTSGNEIQTFTLTVKCQYYDFQTMYNS